MYEHIVVGTDGSEPSLDAVRKAGELAGLTGADEIHVVSCCHSYSDAELYRIQKELPAEFHDLINPHAEAHDNVVAATAVLPPGLRVIPHEMDGHPADSILGVAERVDADLIVVGARGLSAVSRFLRGSVSTKIAHHASCDVLIVEHDD